MTKVIFVMYIIICDKCVYADVTKTFNKINNVHIKNIKENRNKNYKQKRYPPVYDAKIDVDI